MAAAGFALTLSFASVSSYLLLLFINIIIIIIITNPEWYVISSLETATLVVAAAGIGLILSSTSDFSSLFFTFVLTRLLFVLLYFLSNSDFLFDIKSRNCYSVRGSSRLCTDTSSPLPPPHCLQQPPNWVVFDSTTTMIVIFLSLLSNSNHEVCLFYPIDYTTTRTFIFLSQHSNHVFYLFCLW